MRASWSYRSQRHPTVLVLSALALLVSCNGSTDATKCRVSGVTISPNATQHLVVGTGVTLTASVAQTGCTPTPSVTWSVVNSSIATLSAETGGSVVVTGVSPGSTAISIVAGGVHATATITVRTGLPSLIYVTLSPATVEEGQTSQALYVVTDDGGFEVSGQTVSWTVGVSSAPGVATVNATTGVVTGVVAGTAVISGTLVGSSPPIIGNAIITVTTRP
jgi:uncharacterized protein YjdB